MGLLACYEVWMCGRSWVRAPAGAIVRRVFHQTRKLVRASLLKCPSILNSKKLKYVVLVVKCKSQTICGLPLMRHPATLITMPILTNYYYYFSGCELECINDAFKHTLHTVFTTLLWWSAFRSCELVKNTIYTG